jgi:hypothetical protein
LIAAVLLLLGDEDEQEDDDGKKFIRHSQEIDSKGRETRALLEELRETRQK